MTVWAIFSRENEYNQPDHNLVKLYKDKPTINQLSCWWSGWVDDDDKKELLQLMLGGAVVRFTPFGTEYRLEEVEVDEV